MTNIVAVLLAVSGLFAAMYGAFGLDVALIVAGITLTSASVLLLYDLDGGNK